MKSGWRVCPVETRVGFNGALQEFTKSVVTVIQVNVFEH
jgi:hypothetical protein